MRRALPVFLLAVSVAAAALVACSASPDLDAPAPHATGRATPVDAGAPEAAADAGGDAAPPDAAPKATTYAGTLAATEAFAFGGDTPTQTFCDYAMTLTGIAVEVALLDSGDVIGATVENRTREAIVGTCPYAPAAPSEQSFGLATAKPTTTGATLVFEGASANTPVTSLVVTLVRRGEGFDANAVWTRTDQVEILNWKVEATIPLVPR